MGLSDDEDNEVPADWDKSSNASSSSSSSASSNKSNKSRTSKNSKSTNDPNSNAPPKSNALGENQDVPQPPSAVHPEGIPEVGIEISITDGLSSPPPPGTVVAARPRHPLPRAPVAMNQMAIPRAPNLMMNPGMPPGMMMPRPMNPMMMIPPMMMPRPPMSLMGMQPQGMPSTPGMAQQPSMMPSAPTLCSMAATNMAAATNHMEINQMGAPVLRLSTQLEQSPSTVSRNNEYETTPHNNVTPAMRAQVEMIRLAAKQTSEPVVDPLLRRKSFREKLVKLYSKVNPKRLEDIDDLLDKYAGREDKLLMGVLDKYECAAVKKSKKEKSRDCDFRAGSSKVVRIIDDDTSEQKSPKKRKIAKRLPSPSPRKKMMTSQEKIRDFYRTRIKKIYKERNPKKLSGLDTLLDKYRGKERDVWLSICDKYSVRPE